VERVPVSSSNLASVGYDSAGYVLEVEFSDGDVYQYLDVPETVFQELVSAPSPGRYLNEQIKNNYRYLRL